MTDGGRTTVDRRRQLLRKRIADSGLAAEQPARHRPIHPGVRYPLSPGQHRMWFLQHMEPTDTALNICVAFRLDGELDPTRLHNAARAVAARHAILRTTYGVDADGHPYQIFQDDVEISWREDDLTHLSADDQQRQISAEARSEFSTPFDLADEPPMRLRLLRLRPSEFVLLLTVHHICWDDDSWQVFFSELRAAYNGHPLSDPPPQFVGVQMLQASAEPTVSDIEYWTNTLRPPPEPLDMPGSTSPNSSKRAERRIARLPGALYSRVEDIAQAHAASPFMVLLAAFGALVRRYTCASDFLIAVPVAERPSASEGAIGYFGNTLLLRVTVKPEHTFSALIDAVRRTCLDGFAHQAVGIDRVVRQANPARSTARDGIDQLVRLGFSMRKSATGFEFDGVRVRQLELGAVTAQLPLTLAVVMEPDGVLVECEYHTGALAGTLVQRMLGHYLQLLGNAVRTPGSRLAGLDTLHAAERATIMEQSQGTLDTKPSTTIVEILESACAATPNAIALASDTTELNYAEIHCRANRLARWLIAEGIGTEDIVGLRMAASVEFVIAMLAVLKAGGAYLPIDPAYPADRIEYVVADARPTIIISEGELNAAEHAAAKLSSDAVTDHDRLRPLRPGHLAYVIYTSGSTGRPKGVAVAHHAIAEHVEGFIAEWTMSAEDRVLQSSSISFDASLLEIFLTLTLGARLVVAKPKPFEDIPYITDLIARQGITTLHMVPSMLSTLLTLPQVEDWRTLRHVPVGGEALPGPIADKFADYFGAELRNHYGPTEAVGSSTHMPIAGPQGYGVVPIGKPNRNVYAYVLDRDLQPVPAEVVGELYLGGAQLARGYLGRPALTAERFVADPFNPGARLYRSGDLVRRNLAGDLEFIGRADEQVKIRGFRIELGEIESVITKHPAVRQCVVVIRDNAVEDSGTSSFLAAFVVPEAELPEHTLDLDQVRAHAASFLPEHMAPSAYTVLTELPLTVSGKLDKRALPTPAPIDARTYRAPQTPTEHRMCSVFTRLFGCERVGAEDSFFALGGHSLLAARLVAQIRAEFGVELTVRAVFDSPTPAGLAARLVEQFRAEFDIDLDALGADDTCTDPNTDPSSGRPEIAQFPRAQRLPLSDPQLGMWFHEQMRGASDAFNLALNLRINGPLDTCALAEALKDLVARHESLRTTFAEEDGVPHQTVHPAIELELEISEITTDELDSKVAELRRWVFPLQAGPLIRAVLLKLDAQTNVLVILVHHIVSDHASLAILFDELISAYRARLQDEAPSGAEPPIQYADYALWQRNAFGPNSEWGNAQLAHWSSTLAQLPPEISIAADFERPPVLGQRSETASFTVSPERRAEITRLAEQAGATEFMVYQAALAVLLHKLGGGTDIAIGSPLASRVGLATAGVVGPFANMVVLRNDLSGNLRLRDAVAHSRDVVLDALAHQEFPIGRLVETLNPPRSPSRNHPLFQTAIHFQGGDWALRPRGLIATGETTVVPVPMDFEISLLDLNLGLKVTSAGELDVMVVANADLYKPQTVDLIAEAANAVVAAFATTPDLPIAALDVLPPATSHSFTTSPVPRETDQRPAVSRGSAATERVLISLLEELLEISSIDPADNFFALGGDSITSVQLAARAAAQGLNLTAPMVFQHMTIADLAAAVDAAADSPAARADSPEPPEYTPMSASGLSADTLAELTSSWQGRP